MNTLTTIPFGNLLRWCELCPRKFARWRERYGKANEHNAPVPRDHWLEEWEKLAIIDYARHHPREGQSRYFDNGPKRILGKSGW